VVFMKSSFLRLVQAVCLEVEFDPLELAGNWCRGSLSLPHV
jgi:hypothetical protein